MTQIKNITELENIVNKLIIKAMELTRDEIFNIVYQKVVDYYNEPVFDGSSVPIYERTGTLMETLTASHIISGNGIHSFTVGWDDEYLEYKYSGWERRWSRGLAGKNYATGRDILEYFNTGRHGGDAFIGGHNYWDESLKEIEKRGNIDGIFKKNLIKLGVPIKQ